MNSWVAREKSQSDFELRVVKCLVCCNETEKQVKNIILSCEKRKKRKQQYFWVAKTGKLLIVLSRREMKENNMFLSCKHVKFFSLLQIEREKEGFLCCVRENKESNTDFELLKEEKEK